MPVFSPLDRIASLPWLDSALGWAEAPLHRLPSPLRDALHGIWLGHPLHPALAQSPIGFWTSLVGPQNQFVHLWGYDDLADYERRCRARDTHPDFPAYLAASGHLITAQETRLIRAVDMSGWRG